MTDARHVLTVLTRLARRRPAEEGKLRLALSGRLGDLWAAVFDVAAEVGDPIGRIFADLFDRDGFPGPVEPLLEALPNQTVALAEVAVVLLRHRCDQDGDGEPALAASLRGDLAARLGAVGRREEALAESDRAMELAEVVPDAGARDRLRSRVLAGRSTNLAELGRDDEALEAIEAAVDIRRELFGLERDRGAVRDLAVGLGLLAACLSTQGRRGDATTAAEEAVGLLRSLPEDEAEAHALLARHLSNLSALYVDQGDLDRGVETADLSLRLARDLAARKPDEFGFLAAVGANNLANDLSLRRRFAEALPLAGEAAEAMAELARGRPQAYGEHHATALNTLSNRLNDLGRTQEAREASERSVSILRDLAARWPAAFEAKLARSLHSLAYRLGELGEVEGALARADEALALRRRLDAREPRAHGVGVAMTLAVRASALKKAGDLPGACSGISAALDRLLVEARVLRTALAREAREIGGRVVLWHEEAGLTPAQADLAELGVLTSVPTFGEIS